MFKAAAFQDLRKRHRGLLLVPGDPSYEIARRVWNGMIDRRPALIAQCLDARDVAACVEVARTYDAPVSVRAGGHNYAGRGVCEGGLMIDLSTMKAIAIDPKQRTARAQCGLKLGEFDRETQKHGLATPLGVATTTGISGLTLGGGYGWIAGKYGLACDNVISMDVVTAEGKILACNAREHADLFWGMRGAGANFGIATHIEYRLHPVSTVYGGPIFHPLTADMVRFYDEFSRSAPDELTVIGGAVYAPNGEVAFATIACCLGSPHKGEKLVQPLRSVAPPLFDSIQQRPYLEMQSLFDADFPPGRRYYNKAHNLRTIGEGAIKTILKYASTMPPHPSGIAFQQLHGAAARVPAGETAFPHRYPHHVAWINPVADEPGQDEAMIRWTRDCWQALLPDADKAVYVNALDGALEEGEQRVREAYGENYERLRALKKQYDPTNFFRQNSNITPA